MKPIQRASNEKTGLALVQVATSACVTATKSTCQRLHASERFLTATLIILSRYRQHRNKRSGVERALVCVYIYDPAIQKHQIMIAPG